jgi:hypothetical protein
LTRETEKFHGDPKVVWRVPGRVSEQWELNKQVINIEYIDLFN